MAFQAVLLADGPVGGSRQLKKEAKRPRGKAPTGPFGRRIRPSDRASSLSSGEVIVPWGNSTGAEGSKRETRDGKRVSTGIPSASPRFPRSLETPKGVDARRISSTPRGVKQESKGALGLKGNITQGRGKRPRKGQRLSILQAAVRSNLPRPEQISAAGQRIKTGLGKLAGDVATRAAEVAEVVGNAAGQVLGTSVVAVGNAGNAVMQVRCMRAVPGARE